MVDKNRRRQPAAKQAQQPAKKPVAAQQQTQQKPQSSRSFLESFTDEASNLISKGVRLLGFGDNEQQTQQAPKSPVKLPEYTGMYQVIPAADVMTQPDFASYPYAKEIAEAAERFGVHPLVLMAVAQQESKLGKDTVSSTGVRGFGQVTKATLGEAFPQELFPGQKPNRDNILHSINTMANYLRSFGPNARYKINDDITAIRAYNMGPGGAKKNKHGAKNRQGSSESFFYSPDIIQRLNLLRLPYSDTVRVGPNALPVPAIYGQRLQQDYDNAARLGLNLDRKAMSGQLIDEKQLMLQKAYTEQQKEVDRLLLNAKKNQAARAAQNKKQTSKGKK